MAGAGGEKGGWRQLRVGKLEGLGHTEVKSMAWGFRASACDVGGLGSIPGSGRSPGGRNGNPLQYSCLENPMDREAWQSTVHGITKSQTQLSN